MDRMGRVQASSSDRLHAKVVSLCQRGGWQQSTTSPVAGSRQSSKSQGQFGTLGSGAPRVKAQLRIRDSAEPPANFSTSGSTNYGTPHPRKPLEQHITMSSNLILVGSFVVRAVSATVSLGTYLPASALACSERHCCHSRIGDRGALGGWRARARLCVSLSGIRHD